MTQDQTRQRGAALVVAITLLAFFSALGTVYVRAMMLEVDQAEMMLREARGRALAEAGAQAALGDLKKAHAAGQVYPVLAQAKTYAFPVYEHIWNGKEMEIMAREGRLAEAETMITDESGKLNLNTARPEAIAQVLAVDLTAGAKIANSVIKEGPLLHLDDLLGRALLTPQQYAGVDPNLVTVYSAVGDNPDAPHLNVNLAPPAVLAAAAGVTEEQAQAAAAKRPFRSYRALCTALGVEPGQLPGVQPETSVQGDELPAPLMKESRCFRIVSRAKYAHQAGSQTYNRASAAAEMVVVFQADGTPRVVYWDAGRAPWEDEAS